VSASQATMPSALLIMASSVLPALVDTTSAMETASSEILSVPPIMSILASALLVSSATPSTVAHAFKIPFVAQLIHLETASPVPLDTLSGHTTSASAPSV
jgi:hypothetical protein